MRDDPNDPGSRPVVEDDGGPIVLVSDRQSLAVDASGLARLARDVLIAEGRAGGELSVSFVTEDEMADLHVRYLGEEGATDVLAFEQDPEDGMIGDVVICPAFAAHAASADGADVDAELRLLLVHGVLHLLGYDHEAEDDRTHMWTRQESYSGVRVP
jgi:probable rRNA maturation factor